MSHGAGFDMDEVDVTVTCAHEEHNVLLRRELAVAEETIKNLKQRISLMNEHSMLFSQCEALRAAIDANISRIGVIEQQLSALPEV